MKKVRWAVFAATAVTISLTPAALGATTGPGSSGAATATEVRAWAKHYKAAHPGHGGKDYDINAKTPAQLAKDPAARQLLGVCGPDQRPVIPILAWEYGGNDHPWINPGAAALVYCVYTPVKPSTAHWQYNAAKDHVTAEVYVRFPEQNPCRNKTGLERVTGCLGAGSNLEILVDTASLNDGAGAGLSLAESSTTLRPAAASKPAPAPPSTPPVTPPTTPNPPPLDGSNPYAAACPAPEPRVQFGDGGDCVSKLQWYLAKAQNAPLAVGGHFGPRTKANSISFQSTHGINPSGLVGPRTWAALASAAAGM